MYIHTVSLVCISGKSIHVAYEIKRKAEAFNNFCSWL